MSTDPKPSTIIVLVGEDEVRSDDASVIDWPTDRFPFREDKRPGGLMRDMADADELLLQGMIELRARLDAGDSSLPADMIVWSEAEIEAYSERVRRFRDAAFDARDREYDKLTNQRRQTAQKGGQVRGAQRQSEADEFWAPWITLCDELAQRHDQRNVASMVHAEMIRADAFPPGSDQAPTTDTIRRRWKKSRS